MVLHRLKNFICVVLALVFCMVIFMGIKVANVSRLSALEGKRTFFLDSASSQGLMKTELTLSDLARVKGECVSFSLNTYGGRYALSADIVQTIFKQFDADILLIEEIAGVTSYYGYTSRWQDYILIEGQVVNLHVAVANGECTVGAPIIFGGF